LGLAVNRCFTFNKDIQFFQAYIMLNLPALVAVFLFGLITGSFLNVCIYRLPRSKSIVYPGSMCTQCQTSIPWHDNIPVFSYLRLKGKCRVCKTPISFRYPMIEILSGLTAAALFLKFGFSLETPVYFVFISSLLVVTFIDIDHRIIPDSISLPGIAVFFATSFFLNGISYVDSIIGILAGGGTLFAIAWGYTAITGKEGMGGGDIKLLAMIGAAIGWKGVIFTIFVSSTVGSLIGIIVMLFSDKNMKMAIPFGPFLSMGAMAHVFFGQELISWYLNLLS
jgi:leader peptidase (prepilin peptidase) / N-methyltransferase